MEFDWVENSTNVTEACILRSKQLISILEQNEKLKSLGVKIMSQDVESPCFRLSIPTQTRCVEMEVESGVVFEHYKGDEKTYKISAMKYCIFAIIDVDEMRDKICFQSLEKFIEKIIEISSASL